MLRRYTFTPREAAWLAYLTSLLIGEAGMSLPRCDTWGMIQLGLLRSAKLASFGQKRAINLRFLKKVVSVDKISI